jgi:hypothetical protein
MSKIKKTYLELDPNPWQQRILEGRVRRARQRGEKVVHFSPLLVRPHSDCVDFFKPIPTPRCVGRRHYVEAALGRITLKNRVKFTGLEKIIKVFLPLPKDEKDTKWRLYIIHKTAEDKDIQRAIASLTK